MARPCPPSATSLISQQGAPGDRASAGPRGKEGDEGAGSPETGGVLGDGQRPPED